MFFTKYLMRLSYPQVLLIVTLLFVIGLSLFLSLSHSRGEEGSSTLRYSSAPGDNTYFEQQSPGRDGDGQRTVG